MKEEEEREGYRWKKRRRERDMEERRGGEGGIWMEEEEVRSEIVSRAATCTHLGNQFCEVLTCAVSAVGEGCQVLENT